MPVTKSIRMSISHCRIQNWGDSGPSELMRSLKTDSRGSRPGEQLLGQPHRGMDAGVGEEPRPLGGGRQGGETLQSSQVWAVVVARPHLPGLWVCSPPG